jgi:hypothetical protein
MLEANLTTTRIPELIPTSAISEAISEFPETLHAAFSFADNMRHRVQDARRVGLISSKAARGRHTPACASHSSYEPDENTAEMLRRVSNVLSALDGAEAGTTSPSHRT